MKKSICIILLALLISACSKSNAPSATVDGFYFDTIVSVNIYEGNSKELVEGIKNLCSEYDQMLSTTIPDSDISKVNKSSSPVPVSKDTVDIINRALYYSNISGGRFDITMDNVSKLWDFSGSPHIPASDELSLAISNVDYRNIQINGDKVFINNPDSDIDLGAIAKGYIADRISDYMRENNATGTISLGGNVSTVGLKPNGQPFKIGIQDPNSDATDPIMVVESTDSSVVTSGTYQRFFIEDGVKYHHILDSKTGYPVNNGIASVTVIAPLSMDADALSTTCFVMGIDEGLNLIENIPDTEVIYIEDDGNITTSSGISH